MPKVSVIVPVYNTEKYLAQCVDSILSQSFTDFELLLINDGSKDKSGFICDGYAKNDPRVKVFHKENSGVSSARNLGLDNAKGEWVTFIDSDDYVDEDHIANMVFNNKDVDFVASNFIAEGWDNWVNIPFAEQQWEYDEMSMFYTETLHRLNYMVCKLFKKSILDEFKIRFNERLSYGEDTLFVYQYLRYIKSAMTLSKVTYHYVCNREGSLSKAVADWAKYAIFIDEICANIQYIESNKNCCCRYARSLAVHNCITPYLKSIRKNFTVYKIQIALQEMGKSEHIVNQIKDSVSWNKSIGRRIFDFLMIKRLYYIAAILLKLTARS